MSKYFNSLFIALTLLFMHTSVSAVELNDVYKYLGTYRVTKTKGLKVYFPETALEAMPGIIKRLSQVRENFNLLFPGESSFEAKVILTDHDDRVSSSSDPDFDWINLGMFEEIGALSTRAYSLEKRFALRLANIMLLRSLASSTNSWKRKIAIYVVPQWFLDGLALNSAFELDSVHMSRLLDMARSKRLYSLSRLNTIVSQPTLIKEEMRFQAHSMIAYWDKVYKKDAGIDLMKSVMKRPSGFINVFRKIYGVSLDKAFKDYIEYVESRCNEIEEGLDCQKVKLEETDIGGEFFRSIRYLSEDERIWVSSKRYSTEAYDLYYQKNGSNERLLLKNVHPLLYVDDYSGEIYIGKYRVNRKKQRRLALYAATPEGKTALLVSEPGSFKPLGKKFGRIFYTSIKSGITRVMSVDPEFKDSTREEYVFPVAVRPLDIALSTDCRDMFFVYETTDFKKNLAVLSIRNDDKNDKPRVLFSSEGDITALNFIEGKIWFAAQKNGITTQLFSMFPEGNELMRHTALPGGVWDMQVVTLFNGGFWAASPAKGEEVAIETDSVSAYGERHLKPIKSSVYKSEYKTSYWLPILSEDDKGFVFGIYNYRSDKLDRSHIVVAPKYGFESKNWGYECAYSQRFDLLKVKASIVDETKEKAYLDNDYFERTRAKILDFEYPLNLSTTLSLGVDLTERTIAKIPQNGLPVPSVGRDHSIYGRINHRAIRTEPYWEIFPRKGRTINAYYKRGSDFLDGEFDYDSMGIKWAEHFELNSNWVLTSRTWLAEDDKVSNNLRRPDDLSIGGHDGVRAFSGSYRSGDSLRAFSLHLGRPIAFQFPRAIPWLYNEFMVAEVFAEMADVRSGREFRFLYDRGVEIRLQALLFRRLPLRIQLGMAWQNGGNENNSFVNVEFADLSELLN
jgi:hypothetical protein